jgi:hypothetical protein
VRVYTYIFVLVSAHRLSRTTQRLTRLAHHNQQALLHCPTPPLPPHTTHYTQTHHTEAAAVGGDGAKGDGLADELMGPDRINELMARCDYVILAAALTPETRGIVGREQLACSKEGQVRMGERCVCVCV